MHAAIADDDSPGSEVEIVRVTICRLRQKLQPHGLAINTVWKIGYRIDGDSRVKIRKLLNDYGADVVDATTPAQQERAV